MLKKVLILEVLIFLLSNCSVYKKPDKLIEKDKLIGIITDIHIADAIVGNERKNISELTKISPEYYYYVFEKHKITRKQYEESIDYYSRKPFVIEEIYDKVINNLEKKEEEMNEQIIKEDK